MPHQKHLTLLHSNDLHGDFLAEQMDDQYVGGISLLSGYVSRVRAEEDHVLYAIAGDMFRGSIIDAEYKGISTIEMMNMLAPDVVTLGNHEVDYGIAHLLFIEKCASFPIVNANLYIRTNNTRLFTPCKILEVAGMHILFIGVITEEVLAQAKQDTLIGSFINTAEAVREVGRICNSYHSLDIDLTVLLTHIGIEEDIRLAEQLDPAWGVDLIIGGHSHTFLDKPLVKNGILIAHAGVGTDQIGRFDLTINTDTNSIDAYTWQLLPISSATAEPDTQMDAVVQKYKRVTDAKYERLVTRFSHVLTHPKRNRETALGNLFADILRDSLGLDVMLVGSGSIRTDTLGPIVVYSSLMEAFPYDDGIYMIKITGAQLKHMLLYMLRDEAFSGHTEFYQLSDGLKVVYSRARHVFDSFTYHGKELEDDRILTVGIQNFHYANLENFLDISYADVKKLQKPRVIATSCLDILEEYLKTHPKIDSKVEGRITILDE